MYFVRVQSGTNWLYVGCYWHAWMFIVFTFTFYFSSSLCLYFVYEFRYKKWILFVFRSRNCSGYWNRSTGRDCNWLGRKEHLLDGHRHWPHRSGTTERFLPQGYHLWGAAGAASNCRWPTRWVSVLETGIPLPVPLANSAIHPSVVSK